MWSAICSWIILGGIILRSSISILPRRPVHSLAGPVGAVVGRRAGGKQGHGVFFATADQRHHAGCHLWADRRRLYDGLWHHWHDQLRARRSLHDRRLYLSDRIHDLRPSRHRLGAGRHPPCAADGHGLLRGLRMGDRANCLSSLAWIVPVGTADLGYRRVDRVAELTTTGAV